MWPRSAPGDADAVARGSSPPPLSPALRVVLVAGTLALPLVAWLLRHHGAPGAGNALSLLLVVAAVSIVSRAFGVRAVIGIAAATAALVAAAGAYGLPPVYWPPVAMNFAVAALFGISLVRGEPLCTRFARLERAPLTPATERYCRRLTLAWALYLGLLGMAGIGIAAYGDERIGAWWCGIVNYALVAALFIGERLVRPAGATAPVMDQVRHVVAVLRSRQG
jgi:uncharacterized membrane protein